MNLLIILDKCYKNFNSGIYYTILSCLLKLLSCEKFCENL